MERPREPWPPSFQFCGEAEASPLLRGAGLLCPQCRTGVRESGVNRRSGQGSEELQNPFLLDLKEKKVKLRGLRKCFDFNPACITFVLHVKDDFQYFTKEGPQSQMYGAHLS